MQKTTKRSRTEIDSAATVSAQQVEAARTTTEPLHPASEPLAIPSAEEVASNDVADQHPQAAAAPPQSPAGNRARFMASMQPTRVTCDLTNAPVISAFINWLR